jgi:alpha-galactosidase
MKSAAKIEKDKVIMAIKVEWKAFGKTPNKGDIWLGNLFRCVGKDPDRGYLAWRPTKTETPNFHIPGAFGEIKFSI